MQYFAVNSVISRNNCSACKLFGISSGDFLTNKVSVGDDRLFTVTATEKQNLYVEFARKLIRLCDGYLSFVIDLLCHEVTFRQC